MGQNLLISLIIHSLTKKKQYFSQQENLLPNTPINFQKKKESVW
jgi:hypothetical protein